MTNLILDSSYHTIHPNLEKLEAAKLEKFGGRTWPALPINSKVHIKNC